MHVHAYVHVCISVCLTELTGKHKSLFADTSLQPLLYTSLLFWGTFQNEVKVRLTVRKSSLSLFRIILRYINPGVEEVSGRITVYSSRGKSGRQPQASFLTCVVVLPFRDRVSGHNPRVA